MDLNVSDYIVLITGGSAGIGLATAHAFAAEGCSLHLAARTTSDLEAAKKSITQAHDVKVTIHAVDLSHGDNVRHLVNACGDIDILVNNAGAIPGGSINDLNEEQWRDAWELKVFGYINMIREYTKKMKHRGHGVIINIIGNAGNQAPGQYAAGVSADAMLEVLTRTVGSESLDYGVRVVGVSPGDLINERGIMFLRRQAEKSLGDPERWQECLAKLPGGRAGTSEEIADAVVFLASPRSGYTSGAVLTIDGGVSARRAVM